MFRVKWGIFLSLMIIILLITSNGVNEVIINFLDFSDSERVLNNNYSLLPESTFTDEIIDISDKSETPPSMTSKTKNQLLGIEPTEETTALIDRYIESDEIGNNVLENVPQNEIPIDTLKRFEVGPKYNPEIHTPNEPSQQPIHSNGHKPVEEELQEPKNSLPDTENGQPEAPTQSNLNLYEQDIAGGSWVDSFYDYSGIDEILSDNLYLMNGDARIKPAIIPNSDFESGTLGSTSDRSRSLPGFRLMSFSRRSPARACVPPPPFA